MEQWNKRNAGSQMNIRKAKKKHRDERGCEHTFPTVEPTWSNLIFASVENLLKNCCSTPNFLITH